MGILMRTRFAAAIFLVVCSVAWGQTSPPSSPSANQQEEHNMPGMSGPDMSNMKGMPSESENDSSGGGAAAMLHTMEGHMDMGPHMKMTAGRPGKPGDAARAQRVVEAARKVAEKYQDYHIALAEGFTIFLPNVPQSMYHFTNMNWAREARASFNPEHPTSLLYERHGDGYTLIGVMYTAPKSFTEDDLDARIPLSIAQWHEHVNFCRPPSSMPREDKMQGLLGPNAQFGLKGSIHTQEACDAAGGTFLPVVFNWMVHVYPFEKDQASIWSVERQHADTD
jgi:hypothetical protein